MLNNHDRMKKCEDRDVPRWLLKARESQDADKTLEAADLNATSNADPSRGVTSQPESLAEDIPSESAASPGPTPGATAPPKRGRGRPRKTPRSAAPPRAEDTPVYCTCRKPYDGRLMIQCDRCDMWFHGRCVGVTVEEAQKLDGYVCPPCSSISISICRRDSDSDEEPRRSWRTKRPETPPEDRYHLLPAGMEGRPKQQSSPGKLPKKRSRSEARGSSPRRAPQGAEGGWVVLELGIERSTRERRGGLTLVLLPTLVGGEEEVPVPSEGVWVQGSENPGACLRQAPSPRF